MRCGPAITGALILFASAPAQAHDVKPIGGHLAYTGGGGPGTSGYQNFLSANFMWVPREGNQEYAGYGLTAMLGFSPAHAFVSPELVAGWSSMFASTGLAVGPVVKIGNDSAGGAPLHDLR